MYALLLLGLLFLGCSQQPTTANTPIPLPAFPTESPAASPSPQAQECTTDTDCVTDGCSGQLCVPLYKRGAAITTCEMRPEYECLSLTSCGCQQGSCGWGQNTEYLACLTEKQ